MRRSTAAVLGTLTGVAMIVGVRMTVPTQIVPVAGDAAEDTAVAESAGEESPDPEESKDPDAKQDAEPEAEEEEEAPANASGLSDGTFKGAGVKNPYGTIQVTIKVKDGEITSADATYPTTGDSARINPPAIKTLKAATLKAESADDVDAVSGATFTSESYKESLQAALDAAKG